MKYRHLAIAIPLASVFHLACATDPVAHVRTALLESVPEADIQKLESSPIPGMFHAVLGGRTGYVTADGRYFIPGDLFDIKSRVNLTEQDRKAARLSFLKDLDASDAITFAPLHPRHTITVFTDVDCGYCRQLHSEIAAHNKLGIAVRYVAYPRSGPESESWITMENVWCAKDRADALTRAKRGEKIAKENSCRGTPIAAQYKRGQELGALGTPMILLEDGRLLGGYANPAQLAKVLEPAVPTTPSR